MSVTKPRVRLIGRDGDAFAILDDKAAWAGRGGLR